MRRIAVKELLVPISTRDLRLGSGLVIGAFVICHFANHAFGLLSLNAMEAARPVLSGSWRSLPGTVLLYGALGIHFALTLQALYVRRTLRMSAKEAGQTILGVALPFLVVGHVMATRLEFSFTGIERTYPEILQSLWIERPAGAAQQSLALVVAWLHFCLGLYFWLRVKAGFARLRTALSVAALLLPVLSLLGFVAAGKELALRPRPLPVVENGVPPWVESAIEFGLVLPIGLVLAARVARTLRLRRHRIRVGYPDGRFVEVEGGSTVLEASRTARIPHQSICGGRARCSTCRVEILRGARGQPAPDEAERTTLARIGAGPRVRLACQFRPVRNVVIAPLVSPAAARNELSLQNRAAFFGEEREIVVMFCDVRDFTRMAADRLPYDVVFLLNRYFELVGRAVAENGGRIDKFIGDGAMALFGLTVSPDQAAAQAIAAAERIFVDLERMNDVLNPELNEAVRVAIAIHQGPAIIGELGYGEAMGVTAVGDTINVASRLEGLAKQADAEMIVSDTAMRSAGQATDGFASDIMSVRGRSHPMEVWLRRPRET